MNNGKQVDCTMYKNSEKGDLIPYEGYCEKTLIQKYAKQIGNAAKGGCGFEIESAKTNIGKNVIILLKKL